MVATVSALSSASQAASYYEADDYYAEGGVNGIERSYAKIATEARDQYTLGYLTSESFYDDKFRPIDVRVDRPNVTVIAKRGYYPSAQDYK